MTTARRFNAMAYKQTTREQWDSAAGAWDSWGPTLEDWLDEATVTMLDLAASWPPTSPRLSSPARSAGSSWPGWPTQRPG